MQNTPEQPTEQEQTKEKEKEKKGGFFSKVGNMASKAGAVAAQKIKEGAQATKETLSDPNLGQKIKDKTSSIATSIKDGTIQAGQEIKKGAIALKNDATVISNNVAEYSKQKGDEISTGAKNIASSAKEKTSNAASHTKDFIFGKPEEEVKYEQKTFQFGNQNQNDPNAVNQQNLDYSAANAQTEGQTELQVQEKMAEISINDTTKKEEEKKDQ